MKSYRVIGLMSGTSLDGLDIAYCEFTKEELTNQWEFSIVHTACIEYEYEFKQQLKESITYHQNDLNQLDIDFGKWIGGHVKNFIDKHQLEVDLISSHGHTIHHQPQLGITVQIGKGTEIARITGIKTVSDFRSLDVKLGGEGAPLVPIGDLLLFSEYEFCLNLGGISNISYDDHTNVRKAYDVSIANMLLNYLSQKAGKVYDDGGNLARSGRLDISLLNNLNALDFYQQEGPKSLGYEWFVTAVKPLFEHSLLSIEDQLHTACEHIAYQLVKTIKHQDKQHSKVLVTGGGAFNTFLISLIQKGLGASVKVVIPEPSLISYKEALIFAFMGLLRTLHINNCLSSVTGARIDSCSGHIAVPPVFQNVE